MNLADLAERVIALSGGGHAVVIGITGAPGAGKTTLARQLVTLLNRGEPNPERHRYAHVPMDGFHLADAELSRMGRLERKGAPDTFDADGYATLLQRLAVPRERVMYAPAFERTIEQPIAGAIPVYPSVRGVVTEGNYLLLDRPGWQEARAACAEVWFCELEDSLRRERLVSRHVEFGKTPAAAALFVEQVDERNARLVQETKDRADLLINLDGA